LLPPADHFVPGGLGACNRQLAVFGAHFRAELSALQGDVLRRQASFVNDCIRFLRNIYPGNTKMVLVGHSMGGVVAKAARMMPNYKPRSITSIIALGAPLQMRYGHSRT
jgi:glycosylphosphatidylinositol deacylase